MNIQPSIQTQLDLYHHVLSWLTLTYAHPSSSLINTSSLHNYTKSQSNTQTNNNINNNTQIYSYPQQKLQQTVHHHHHQQQQYPSSSIYTPITNILQQDCRIILSRIKILVYQYYNNSPQQSQISIQLLYQHINQTFPIMQQYYSIFKPAIIAKIKCNNLFEAVIVPVVLYYVKQLNNDNTNNMNNNINNSSNNNNTGYIYGNNNNRNDRYQNILDNIYNGQINKLNSSNTGIIQCLCNQSDINNTTGYCTMIDTIFCYRCGRLFHSKCFTSNNNNNYNKNKNNKLINNNNTTNIQQLWQCPFCYLQYCLPDRQVIYTLFQSYLPPVNLYQTQQIISVINLQFQLSEIVNQELLVQLRCTRINNNNTNNNNTTNNNSNSNNNNYQITWPQICDIYLDQTISISYKPLSINSPLKKRHDSYILIPIKQLINSQQIKIVQHFSPPSINTWHLITLVAIKQHNQQYIFNNIYNNPYHTLSQQQSQLYLNKLFIQSNKATGQQQQLQVQRLVISNKCQYYCQQIKYPCRSRHCVTHYQPFDLYSFICSSVQAKQSIKRWKCPICGVRAYDVVCDKYLQRVMKQERQNGQKQKNQKKQQKQKQGGNQYNHIRNNSKNNTKMNNQSLDKLIINNN